jgi:lipase maturation factor
VYLWRAPGIAIAVLSDDAKTAKSCPVGRWFALRHLAGSTLDFRSFRIPEVGRALRRHSTLFQNHDKTALCIVLRNRKETCEGNVLTAHKSSVPAHIIGQMWLGLRKGVEWLLGPEGRNHLLPRWIFLRALGLIYFSAFYSLVFQIRGLIGPHGLLPATDYLPEVGRYFPGLHRFWFAPTLLWGSSTDRTLMALCWVGLAASVLLIFNLWPRGMLAVCFVCFLSFVAAAQDFSNYQSDGMLLEAGFISFFFAPKGFRPALGASAPPSHFSYFLLLWEWFRIYFESGVVKLASGDYSWRHFTAMDDYYQNGPLPTWVGWYVQHLPHKRPRWC